MSPVQPRRRSSLLARPAQSRRRSSLLARPAQSRRPSSLLARPAQARPRSSPFARPALRACLRVLAVTTVLLWLGAALYVDHLGGLDESAAAPYLAVSGAAPALLLLVRALGRDRLPSGALAALAMAVAVLSLGVTGVLRVLGERPGEPVERTDAYALFEISALVLVLALTLRHGAPRTSAVAAPLLLAALVLRPVAVDISEGSLTITLFAGLIAGAVATVALGLRLVVADRRHRDERLRLEQRLTFARDLHDYVAHHVMGIVVHAQGAQAVAAARPEMVPPALAQIEQAGTDALAALRRMVSGLRSAGTAEEHTPHADLTRIRRLVADFTLPGAEARLVEEGPLDRLPTDTMTVVHHLVMEALTNVRKHARDARQITVRLSAHADRATAVITNDGASRPAHSRGYGLTGLDERVTSTGGTFAAGTDSHGQWCVSARLPLPGRALSA
ncbi:sensor histidine kinase [Streptomyces sp. NPDC060184]|uniref:sensor histidine kinase n=1 Tax=Streptomyces sp. NPDC060184 TaxID=3347064 RepID=UPI00364E98F4